MSIVCQVCGKGPAPEYGGVTVFRAQAVLEDIDVTSAWICAEHGGKATDPETQRLIEVLEGRQ